MNLQMVKDGLAEVYRGIPALGQNIDPYWKAEEEAKKAGGACGCWGSKYVSPEGVEETHGELAHSIGSHRPHLQVPTSR